MFIKELLGTFIGQISVVTIVLILIMAAYFTRKFKAWADRDAALEKNKQR